MDDVFLGASLSELIAPPLKNSSKRQTNAAESAAIDALFDDGPKQKGKQKRVTSSPLRWRTNYKVLVMSLRGVLN
jgi:hypothetical protein